jgi:hypothetical protein
VADGFCFQRIDVRPGDDGFPAHHLRGGGGTVCETVAQGAQGKRKVVKQARSRYVPNLSSTSYGKRRLKLLPELLFSLFSSRIETEGEVPYD